MLQKKLDNNFFLSREIIIPQKEIVFNVLLRNLLTLCILEVNFASVSLFIASLPPTTRASPADRKAGTMARFELQQRPLKVSYGRDKATGYFLQVMDARLMSQQDASDDVNAVTSSFFSGKGTRIYFDVNTGWIGFGRKVRSDAMVVFFRRFGVSEKSLKELG